MQNYRLTKRKLAAMAEALIFRLAGEIDTGDHEIKDYNAALDWVQEKISQSQARTAAK
jgi:alpha/beta superfamily hydrolase